MHRDVKPANFLMGPDIYSTSRPSSCDRVNVIDFGLAKKYTSGADGQHIKNSLCDSHGVGTPLFASINTHRGEGVSLLLSFFYILFGFFFLGCAGGDYRVITLLLIIYDDGVLSLNLTVRRTELCVWGWEA